jgi:hypothetical protein
VFGEPPEPHEQVDDRAAGSNAVERQVVVAPPAILALNLAAAAAGFAVRAGRGPAAEGAAIGIRAIGIRAVG